MSPIGSIRICASELLSAGLCRLYRRRARIISIRNQKNALYAERAEYANTEVQIRMLQVVGEPRIDEESYELRFFGKDEIPELFAEDHIAALDAYFSGVRYPLNMAGVVDGPYPFLQVRNMTVGMSVMWFFIVLVLAYVLAWLIWLLNKKIRI